MRPVVVTAVLLLVVLMSMSASAGWNPGEMCRTKYPATPCRKNVGSGFFQFGPNRCVKAFGLAVWTDRLDQWDAEDKCEKYDGGRLVSIHSLEELCQVECVMYRANTFQHKYWIGLKREDHGFQWSDGSNLDYSYWAGGQPDNRERGDCVEMNYQNWGQWNDVRCELKRPYVCQVNI